MNGNHIEFWKLESEEQADKQHLADCAQCRRQLDLYRFLKFQTKSVHTMEAPPFFAARVQALVGETKSSVIFYFERIAAQLAPLLTVLILATSFLIYSVSKSEEPGTALLEASYPEMTVESVIGFAVESDEGPGK